MGPEEPAPRTLERLQLPRRQGPDIRVFPLSNWTELDVWQYIDARIFPIVPLYYAKLRPMVVRGGTLIPVEQDSSLLPGEKPQMVMCRMRSLGCSPCTGAIRSDADTIPKIIDEMNWCGAPSAKIA